MNEEEVEALSPADRGFMFDYELRFEIIDHINHERHTVFRPLPRFFNMIVGEAGSRPFQAQLELEHQVAIMSYEIDRSAYDLKETIKKYYLGDKSEDG